MKEILMVPIEKIVANPYQPRIEFNEESLMDLAQSIRENGLIQPVTLKEKDVKILEDKNNILKRELEKVMKS